MVAEREKFIHMANALEYDTLTLVADLVTQPPAVQPHQCLKERLLLSHQLTAVQMAENILDMPEFGDRRPSKLPAAMMEFCLEGEVASAFFCAFFLHCLPQEIRVLLIDEVRGNLKDLAISADELYQHQKATPVSMLDCAVNKELAEAVVALAMKLGKGNSPAVRSQAARAAATVVTPMAAKVVTPLAQRCEVLLRLQQALVVWC